MPSGSLAEEIRRRRTFAIISHPDAGKTTLTEKLLLFGGAIQMAGTVKGRKATRHATSDWMRLEQQRGISVTSSVMQFPFDDCIVNLLDTPGHEDFSEDTYRTLTAVDSALMVIDCAKGVEERTIKLMEVCRLRDTPIMTFVNKLDRDGRAPIELLDEIESVLKIQCAPITWPIGMGRDLLGVYHLIEDKIYVYVPVEKGRVGTHETIPASAASAAREFLGDRYAAFPRRGRTGARCKSAVRPRALSRGATDAGVLRLGRQQFRRARIAVRVCRPFAAAAAAADLERPVDPEEAEAHRFRVQDPGEHGSRPSRPNRVHAPLFRALHARHAPASRAPRQGHAYCRCADLPCRRSQPGRGGLCGRHHRTAQSRHASTSATRFSEGEKLTFTGVPNFAPEIFRRAVLKDPLRMKALQKGCRSFARRARRSCSSRCATTISSSARSASCSSRSWPFGCRMNTACNACSSRSTSQWRAGSALEDEKRLGEFRDKAYDNLAIDHAGRARVPRAHARQSGA